MNKHKTKQNGITLISLIISIIVMLILAGVSINAVVGDNGVIGKAQDAVFLNSCAYLEEYFNQLYATCTIDGASEGDTPLHTIMNNGYQHYFFSTSEGTCLKKNYINEETGESQTLVLYLVKKEQLPADIQAQLAGGEGLESREYRKLRGCYGITSDLQAYYCEDGIDTLLGLTTGDLNADSPDIMFADENSVLAQVVNGGTAPIMNQGLKTIKKLTIDSAEELSLLAEFSRFINLTEVYFSGLTINTLSGIEGAVNSLTYVKFANCNVQDYSALNGLTNLTQLYLVKPAGMNEEIVRLGSTDKGIANGEFSKLQYFGIVGDETYLNDSTKNYSGIRYGITDISSLANFSDVTKKAIKYMNLQNLQLTSIASLVDFTNVYLIRLEENALATFEGIQNMSTLRYLIAPVQYSDTTAAYTLGANEGATASETDALKYIYKNNNSNTSLYYVDLRSNTKLKYVDALSTCTGIRYLYMDSCTSIQNASTIKTILGNCGTNYAIPGTYGLEIIADNSKVISLAGKTLTIEEFEQLKNRTSLTHLNLQSITITDASGTKLTNATTPTFNETVNNVLATCTNLQYLKLHGLSNLTTIDFINSGKCTKLIELDLYGTGVVDLTNLNTYATSLKTLSINNAGIDITTIQTTIARCNGGGKYWSGNYYGCGLRNWNLIAQLEKCTELKTFCSYWGDTTGITNGKTLNLTNTNIENFTVTWYWCTIQYPNTIKRIGNDYCKPAVLTSVTPNLTYYRNVGNRSLSTLAEWETSMKSLTYATNLNHLILEGAKNLNSSQLQYLEGLNNLTTFEYRQHWETYTTGSDEINLNGIGSLKNLKTLTIYGFNYCTDISDLANCTNLESLSLTYCKEIIDISALSSLTKLKTLTLNNNKISDISSLANCTELTSLNLNNNQVSDVYPLMNCTKLETLYIQNNALTDFGYYKDASGRSIGYEVMDVFYDLNYEKKGALKNLYMSGNTFDDTEILWDLNWEAGNGGIFKPTT